MSQYTKYYLYKKQQRISGSSDAWVDVIPTTYSYNADGTMTPVVAEEQSADCGYVPPIEPIYKWENMNINTDYICEGTTKYYKQQRFVSYDNGNTWQPLSEYRKGALYQEDSEDCGYSVVYKWENVIGEYTCSGCTKYQKTQKYVSYDGGTTWSAVSPAEYGIGNVIEQGSTDCGCSTQYRWVVAASEYICSGTSKYTKEYYQVSYDGGSTWQNVVPQQTRAGEMIESASTDCGYVEPIYKWVVIENDYECVGVDKYQKTQKYASYDNGFSWSAVTPAVYGVGQLIEANSEDCGYGETIYRWVETEETGEIGCCVTPNVKSVFDVPSDYTYTTWRTKNLPYTKDAGYSQNNTNIRNTCKGYCLNDDITGITFIGLSSFKLLDEFPLPNSLVAIGEYALAWNTKMKELYVPDSVENIDNCAFYNSGLETIYIGSNIKRIGNEAFNYCGALKNVFIKAVVPPAINLFTFTRNSDSLKIYVPAQSVNAYKTASEYWRLLADRIEAMPNNI